jgi:hypothetical protein
VHEQSVSGGVSLADFAGSAGTAMIDEVQYRLKPYFVERG